MGGSTHIVGREIPYTQAADLASTACIAPHRTHSPSSFPRVYKRRNGARNGSTAMRRFCLAGAIILAHPAFGQTPSLYEQAAATIQSGQFAEAVRLLEPRLQQAPWDLKALTLMGMAVSAGG